MADLAWLYNLNRGIFMTPGREEEWTLSIAHTDEAADAYIAVFEELARDLTASSGADQRHGLARRERGPSSSAGTATVGRRGSPRRPSGVAPTRRWPSSWL